MSVEELAYEWRELLAAGGVDMTEAWTVDASGGSLYRPSMGGPNLTSIEHGFVLGTATDQLVLAFRPSAFGDEAPPVEVIVRALSEVRETRKNEDRSFFIVFNGDGLFRPPNNAMRGDAWELRHSDPDQLHRDFLALGLPW